MAMNILNNGRFGMAAALSGTMKAVIAQAVSVTPPHECQQEGRRCDVRQKTTSPYNLVCVASTFASIGVVVFPICCFVFLSLCYTPSFQYFLRCGFVGNSPPCSQRCISLLCSFLLRVTGGEGLFVAKQTPRFRQAAVLNSIVSSSSRCAVARAAAFRKNKTLFLCSSDYCDIFQWSSHCPNEKHKIIISEPQ